MNQMFISHDKWLFKIPFSLKKTKLVIYLSLLDLVIHLLNCSQFDSGFDYHIYGSINMQTTFKTHYIIKSCVKLVCRSCDRGLTA